MNNRNSIFDLSRFIAAICIMFFHINFVGWRNHPCMNGYIYVEFFYILSGYFTAKHFWKNNSKRVDKETIRYIINKYKNFLRFSIVPTILIYGIFIYNDKTFSKGIVSALTAVSSMTLEILFLKIDNVFNGTIWFLAAMVIVLPVLSILLQTNKHVAFAICFVVAYYIYASTGIVNNTVFPINCLRAASAMSVGVVLCYLCDLADGYHLSKFKKWIMTVIQGISLLFPVWWLYTNRGGCRLYT